jgi:hypothetical protein
MQLDSRKLLQPASVPAWYSLVGLRLVLMMTGPVTSHQRIICCVLREPSHVCLRLGTAPGDILRLPAGSVDSDLLTWAAGSIPEARLFGLLHLAEAFASR